MLTNIINHILASIANALWALQAAFMALAKDGFKSPGWSDSSPNSWRPGVFALGAVRNNKQFVNSIDFCFVGFEQEHCCASKILRLSLINKTGLIPCPAHFTFDPDPWFWHEEN